MNDGDVAHIDNVLNKILVNGNKFLKNASCDCGLCKPYIHQGNSYSSILSFLT